MSCEHTVRTYTRYTADKMHKSNRYNVAAHTPCVCNTPISEVLLWLVVFIEACCPYSIVCLTRYQIFSYAHTQADFVPVSSSPLSLLLLLRIAAGDPNFDCSSCAQHSAPTAAAGSVLCACGRSARYSQHYRSACCCHRHWPMHVPTAVCDRHFCSVPIIPGRCTFVESRTTNRSDKHRVQQHSYKKYLGTVTDLLCVLHC